jgi:hypothetical protein
LISGNQLPYAAHHPLKRKTVAGRLVVVIECWRRVTSNE